MKNRSSQNIALGILLLALVLSPVPFLRVKSKPNVDYFDTWNPTLKSCGAHEDVKNTEVSGTIWINTPSVVEPNEAFSIVLQISGFTEANNRDRADRIILGLDKDDAQNRLFTGGKTTAETNHEVDSNGNSKSPYHLDATAPPEFGEYTLLAYAVFEKSKDWYYVKGITTIKVGNADPEVVLTHPNPGTVHEESVHINGTVIEDIGISTVELKVDDSPYTNITSAYNPETGTFTYDLDLSEFSEGVHQILVRATDLGGKFSETTVEIIIPAASVTTPETTLVTTEPATTAPVTVTQTYTEITTSVTTTSSTTEQRQTTVTTTELGSPLFLTVFTVLFAVVMLGIPVLRHKKN